MTPLKTIGVHLKRRTKACYKTTRQRTKCRLHNAFRHINADSIPTRIDPFATAVAINVNIHKLKDELDSRAGTVESNMCRVHEEDKAADLQLRGELNALSAVFSAGHDQLTNSVATLAVALGELHGTGPASRPAPAPGLDTVKAAQVIGLDSELRNEEGRTAQLPGGRLTLGRASGRGEAQRRGSDRGSAQRGSRPLAPEQAEHCGWTSDRT